MTKSGKEYLFNKEILKIFAEKLPGEVQERLRLPIFFYFDADVTDSALITEEAAVSALQVLGDLSTLRVVRDGRLWVGRANRVRHSREVSDCGADSDEIVAWSAQINIIKEGLSARRCP